MDIFVAPLLLFISSMPDIYAAFDDRRLAQLALDGLVRDPEIGHAQLHTDRPSTTELSFAETRGRIWIVFGALLGAAVTLGLVALLSFTGLAGDPGDSQLSSFLAGGMGGALLGALAGGISMSVDRGSPARRLDREFALGRCVVLFQTSRRNTAEIIERLRQAGSPRVRRMS